MTGPRFWIVGGEYTSMDFRHLAAGSGCLVGPFENIDEARSAWRQLSEERRCEALVRYTIAQEPLGAPRAAPAYAESIV